ncbi:hypothetical protein SNE40_004694 [Patella caerulea]|uniref:Neprilysin n=1 Tax=Patella caerulea TaxID=87958 RepID=A0AAN8KCG9_PATCE
MASKYSAENGGSVTGSKNILVASPETIRFEEGGWCSRRSTLEKWLMCIIFLACAAITGLVIAFVLNTKPQSTSTSPSSASSASDGVCLTPDCIRVATRIVDAIDSTIKPCDDFYTYACGNWKRKHVIPEDKSSYGSFTLVSEDVQIILKNLLETPIDPSDLESLQKAKILYASCLNETRLEEYGIQPLLDFLPRVGAWPVISSNWSDNGYSLEDLLIKLAKYNNFPVIDMGVYADQKKSDENILYLDQPGFGMPGQKYYLKGRNDTMVKAYEDLATKVAVLLGANETTAKQDMMDMVDFEWKLANISVPSEQRRDSEKLYNKMTIADFMNNYTDFNWLSYIQGIMSAPTIDINITLDEPVINYSPPYFDKLFAVLAETSPRTVTNYVIWRIVKNRITSITKQFRDLLLQYGKVLSGTSSVPARWKTCVSYAGRSLGKAVGRGFIKQAFDEEAKADMLMMISNLQKSFNNLLQTNDWMDEITRTSAKEKSDVIGNKIGYEERILNDTYLNNLYENYTYKEEEYFWNIVGNIQESSAYNKRQLRLPVDKTKWHISPSTVNAYYSGTNNEIVFPAGILQPPFYHKNFPQSINYGGIGVVIGHEITHGFDDQGRQYDKSGNLRQWWTDDVITKFKSKAQCVIDQYGGFTVPEAGIQINGINTQGENIADNGGLKQSFQAYRNWVKQRGKEEMVLPGLDFTPNQLFFINFAQIWCSNMRKESAINRVLTGVHSPNRFRVIGTLRNSAEFAEAFSCPASSFMNPDKKCKVW